jgi:S1-C subfamily serine protease
MNTNQSAFLSMAAFSQGMADLVDELAKPTVLVNARKRLPVSGLLIQANEVLTVDHGVEKEDGIEVLVAGNGIVTGKLIGRDPRTDLALIRLEKDVEGFQPVDQSSARVGMPVLMIARPDPEGHQASYGIITSIGSGLRTVKGSILDHYIASDAIPYPGFSGGPLVAFDGGVLGINTSGLVGGISLAVPIGLAVGVASQLANFGHVKRGFLGIRSQKVEIAETLRKSEPKLPSTGLLVVGLENDGPGASAGILVGDILVRAGEHDLSDHDDLVIMLAGDVAGKEIPFHIVRGGVLTDILVKLGVR